MLKIKYTSKMKRDVKRIQKRGHDLNKLASTLVLLAAGGPMPLKYQDHQLKGDMREFRECHVDGESNWLLVYRIINNSLILSASGTGTHSDLFDE
jgi:mRNA interferase YafQ